MRPRPASAPPVHRKLIEVALPLAAINAASARGRPDLERYAGRKLTVIAWLWARTVKSPNPAFRDVDAPLASTSMLSTRKGKEAWVEPVLEGGGYRFTVKASAPEPGVPAPGNAGVSPAQGLAVGQRVGERCGREARVPKPDPRRDPCRAGGRLRRRQPLGARVVRAARIRDGRVRRRRDALQGQEHQRRRAGPGRRPRIEGGEGPAAEARGASRGLEPGHGSEADRLGNRPSAHPRPRNRGRDRRREPRPPARRGRRDRPRARLPPLRGLRAPEPRRGGPVLQCARPDLAGDRALGALRDA